MNVSEVAITAAITASVAGAAYVALNPREAVRSTETVAEAASCRAVEQAILAYEIAHGTAPARITQLTPYVRGDISAYRIVRGAPAGPGC